MAYQQGNYQFVINSSFKPFSMQEMLVPLNMYKEAYEKTESQYEDIADKAGQFSYLEKTLPEDSEARQIYEGYAKDVLSGATDLASNGLSVGNRRSLLNLKRRYSGEIGRLDKADKALQVEKARRMELDSKDPTMMYSTNNLNIDQFLDGKTPNTYSISGDYLYKKGMEIGALASSRMYSDPTVKALTNQYNNIISEQGINPALLDSFRSDLSAIPAFQKAVEAEMRASGADANLTGVDRQRAVDNIVNGIVNGAVYKRTDNIQTNGEYINAADRQKLAMTREGMDNEMIRNGYEKVNGKWQYNSELDPNVKRARAPYEDYSNPTPNDKIPHPDDGTWAWNGGYDPRKYYHDPNSKSGTGYKKTPAGMIADPNSPTGYSEDTEAKADDEIRNFDEAASKNKDLKLNAEGYDVTDSKGNKRHYTYYGAIVRHGNKWYSGKMGEADDGTSGIFGFMYNSNALNKFNHFSMKDVDKNQVKKIRVLGPDEATKLMNADGLFQKDSNNNVVLDDNNQPTMIEGLSPEQEDKAKRIIQYQKLLNRYAKEHPGIDPRNLAVQIVEVPTEDEKDVDYSIAISE